MYVRIDPSLNLMHVDELDHFRSLYGITCIQTYLYYRNYVCDPVRTRLLAAVLWYV